MLKATDEEMEMARLREENRHLRGLLTQREQTHQENLEQRARLFDSVLSSIVDFAYTFDREGRFTYMNQALLDLFQLKREEAVGKTCFELNYPLDLATKLTQQIRTVFETGQIVKDEGPYTGAAGTTGYYEYIFVPVFNTEGQVETVAGSTRDISERYAMEEQLREANTRREATLNTGEVGTWTWNIPADQVVADKNLARFFGVSEEDAQGGPIAHYIDAVYPDDREHISTTIQMALEKQESYEAQYRLGKKDGAVRWVIARGFPEYDPEGKPVALHGVALDITELKKREAEIHALNHRLRRAVAETHHRVKNNLQVVAAMIEMQVLDYQRKESVPLHELQRLLSHVHTLSLVHDLLTVSPRTEETGRVSTRAMVDKLLSLLQRTAGKQSVHYRAEEIALSSKQCLALALVLNELVTNALKHGKDVGEVALWVENSRVNLTVSDDGAGFPQGFDVTQHANTGLELVENLVATDLLGTVEYSNPPEGGGRVLVTFPLPTDED